MIERTAPFRALLLRLTLGTALIAHGPYLKPFVFTMPGTVSFFEKLGLPGGLAWIVLAVETLTGIMLLIGLQVRLAALAALPVLLGATWAHGSAGWLFAHAEGGWEYPAFWSLALVAQALLGEGALALSPILRQPATSREARA